MTEAPARLTEAQRIAWLRLIRSDNIGPATFRDLLNHFGSAAAALDAVPELAERGGRRIRICPAADAERELAAVEGLGGRVVALGEADYPPWLRAIDTAPPLVTVRGDAACLSRPMVAVVGSRNASIAGRKFAMQLAAGLGEAGFAIASGLARGIDAAAHEAALSTGTAAVFAGGLDHPYPPENVDLAARILDRGGVHLTEMPMGHVARGKDFPRRNRIISGLSLAVVVVEAALRSGSLITARRAADQGRLVFAVPGSPLDPRAGGTNLLLKEGVSLVTSVDDIISEVRPMVSREPVTPPSAAGEEETEATIATDADESERARIVDAMGQTPVELDEIIRFTGLRPAVVRLVLLELELAGRIEHHPGGRVSIVDRS
jgi:DNA processing protein